MAAVFFFQGEKAFIDREACAQKLAELQGVGQVFVYGSSQPAVRVEAELPATVFFPDGRQTGAWTLNLSKGGGAFRLEDATLADNAEKVVVRLPCGVQDALFPAAVVNGGNGMLRVQFAPLTLEEEQLLVAAILGRGDAWSGWEYGPIEGPFRSMIRVIGLALGGMFVGGRERSGR